MRDTTAAGRERYEQLLRKLTPEQRLMTVDATTLDVALRVAQAIESVGGAYFVGGSLASSMQGEPRATNGVDIVMEIPLGAVSKFIAALGPDFEADPDVSDRQWRDVVQVLTFSGEGMDNAYLHRWSEELGITDLLSRARGEVATR